MNLISIIGQEMLKPKKSDLATVLIIETIKIKVNLLLYDVKSVLFLNFVLSPNHDVKTKTS